MIGVEWDNKFSVGHERIDHEHQVFLDLIKNASVADDEQFQKDKILRLLEEVRKYADFHFYSEENIMLDHGYPAYEEHRKEHKVLLANLDDRIYDYRVGKADLSAIVEFLFSWFALHTVGSDKKLVQYIGNNAQG